SNLSCSIKSILLFLIFFFFTATRPTAIYTLSLHDALPIYHVRTRSDWCCASSARWRSDRERRKDPIEHSKKERKRLLPDPCQGRSEEHTSELQSLAYLVCRLLLEKKKQAQAEHLDKLKTHP